MRLGRLRYVLIFFLAEVGSGLMQGASPQECAAPPGVAGGAVLAQARHLIWTAVLVLEVAAAQGRRGARQAKCQGPIARVSRYGPGPEEYDQSNDYGQYQRKR